MANLPIEKMQRLERRLDEIEGRMAQGPEANVYVRLASEYAELEPVVNAIRGYNKTVSEIAELKDLED